GLLPVLASLPFFLHAMDGVANVKDFTKGNGARRTEIPALASTSSIRRVIRVDEHRSKKISSLKCRCTLNSCRWRVDSRGGSLRSLLDPWVLHELLNGVSLLRVYGK